MQGTRTPPHEKEKLLSVYMRNRLRASIFLLLFPRVAISVTLSRNLTHFTASFESLYSMI